MFAQGQADAVAGYETMMLTGPSSSWCSSERSSGASPLSGEGQFSALARLPSSSCSCWCSSCSRSRSSAPDEGYHAFSVKSPVMLSALVGLDVSSRCVREGDATEQATCQSAIAGESLPPLRSLPPAQQNQSAASVAVEVEKLKGDSDVSCRLDELLTVFRLPSKLYMEAYLALCLQNVRYPASLIARRPDRSLAPNVCAPLLKSVTTRSRTGRSPMIRNAHIGVATSGHYHRCSPRCFLSPLRFNSASIDDRNA